jgi:hypothetical protein
MKDWVMRKLGWPLNKVEITEDQLQDCINDAVEEFTKYVQQEIQYLALDLEEYNTSGFTLPGNVQGIFALEESSIYGDTIGGINTLFSVQNTMWNAGMFPIPGQGGGGWIDFEMAMSYIDLIKRMTAAKFYFEFNERDQLLTLVPPPTENNMKGHICVGTRVIRADDKQYGESWVKRYTLALAKVMVGNNRSKYAGAQLLAGASINAEMKQEGLAEQDKLLEELRSTYVVTTFFMG